MNIETIKKLQKIPNFKLTPEQQALLDAENIKNTQKSHKDIVRHKTSTRKTTNVVRKHSTELIEE